MFGHFMCRKCYEDIFDLLVAGAEEGIKHFAITGTPGIGKSFFFTCILYRLTKDRSKNTSRLRSSSWKPTRIICQTAAIKHACFDLENQSVHRVTEEEAENFVRQSETLYVIDGHDSPSLLSTCVSVFIAAPGSSDYQQFLKHHHLLECCFPVWTKDELTACRKQCNSNILEEMMLERLRIYGGMARAIFASDLSLPPADMEAALADPIAVARIRNLGVHRGLKGRVHLLLLMIVSDDGQYQFSHAAFASKYVFDQLWEKHPQQMISNLQDMLRERCTEISQPLFEAYRHRVLSSGGI
ncbi:hypothetical protein BJ741DRAFT_635875 [Chytriomyces cf. hyalinus JEL632]|nr:hypothetical protein BJ741DRAFT_635875 [Chytriomyces cf. hyalinus JEL632]